jgi:phosphatidylethanolamine/phosphatidyl-N-methylethanolamine N-methyltransferase
LPEGELDHFIRNIKKTGAVSSCSSEVARILSESLNLASFDTVVELGSGTGAITKKLLQHVSPDALFMALELNEHFVEETRKCCPKAIVYHDSAENIKKYLNKHGKETCDCIISTLPWTLFNEELQKKILASILDVLPPGGDFLTVSYTFSSLMPAGRRFRKLMRGQFSEVRRTKPVWKNLPPLYIYHCKK